MGAKRMRPEPATGAPIWNVLPGLSFGLENPPNEGWIRLDFLGFSRPKRAFSMGYTGFPEIFFSASLLALETAGRLRQEAFATFDGTGLIRGL
jgi:hypothetical protein